MGLGVEPYLGRFIHRSDDLPGTPSGGRPVLLSCVFWRERFSADHGIIGRRLVIAGAPAVVIGVAPRAFRGVYPGIEPKFYLPLRFVSVIATRELVDDPQILYGCSAIGRLSDGVTIAATDAEAARLGNQLLREFVPAAIRRQPEFSAARLTVRSARAGLPSGIEGEYAEPLLVMQSPVAVVLLLCCINVGGLLMARVYLREQEFAVRSAIGAERWRMMRQYLTECWVVAVWAVLSPGPPVRTCCASSGIRLSLKPFPSNRFRPYSESPLSSVLPPPFCSGLHPPGVPGSPRPLHSPLRENSAHAAATSARVP